MNDPGLRRPTEQPGKDGGNCLRSLISWWPVAGTVFRRHNYQRVSALSVFSRHFTCSLSPALTPVTHFHCTATTACIISDWNWCLFILMTLPEASTARDGTDFYTQVTKRSCRSVVFCQRSLFCRREPQNLKPLHGRLCGHFREAQSADCLM